jgi:hypothetical protein
MKEEYNVIGVMSGTLDGVDLAHIQCKDKNGASIFLKVRLFLIVQSVNTLKQQ